MDALVFRSLKMAKKGISEKNYKDGRKLFTHKKYTGLKVHDWPCIKYKKIRMDTGYSLMVKMPDGENLWINRKRCVWMPKIKKIFLNPDYYIENFFHIKTV